MSRFRDIYTSHGRFTNVRHLPNHARGCGIFLHNIHGPSSIMDDLSDGMERVGDGLHSSGTLLLPEHGFISDSTSKKHGVCCDSRFIERNDGGSVPIGINLDDLVRSSTAFLVDLNKEERASKTLIS